MDITAQYNRSDFLNFLSNSFLPDDFESAQDFIILVNSNSCIKSAVKLGSCPSLDLSVYEFLHTGSRDPRVKLSHEAFSMLARYDNTASNALAVFYNKDAVNWRLSLITGEYSAGAKKGQVTRGFSNPRRYSYLLGENCKQHTPQSMLFKGNVTSLEDLASRFAVEVVTKEFYKALFDWYDTWAVATVKFPAGAGLGLPKQPDAEANRRRLIHLITRLIFVWFLKHKDNLIPEWIFNKDAVGNVLKTFDPHSGKEGNYYNGILQNLFFAALNKEIEKRAFAGSREHYDSKTFYRDHKDSLFRISQSEFIEKFAAVPFLNGGLFECLDCREKQTDGFSREKNRAAFVPNCLFFGDGKKEGIIDIFNRYNFTAEENTPQDIDIALDPELLGNVFENLLGTYNAETQSTARKESGSFYTPREIVGYMVDASLKEYFKGKFSTDNELTKKLDTLFSYHETAHNFSGDEVETLMRAIQQCTILDPACGSGAFPMGVLNKLTFIMGKLDPDNKLWEAIQIQKAAEEAGDTEQRNERIREISGVFELNKENYGRKLFLIENCIFGIDIQPIAIQISKLRFFISLIVDQKTGGTKENNYNVLPLPNLETKFVSANTLIGVKREQGVLADPEIEIKQHGLLVIRHKHFSAKKAGEKNELRAQDAVLSKELAALLKKDGFCNSADAQKMADWNPYDQTRAADFFDPYWMFGITDGFDVVIGNPPYVDSEHMIMTDESLRNLYKKIYKTAKGNWDLFVIFIEKSMNLTGNTGLLALIIPNKLISQDYASDIRSMITEGLLEIRDYSRLDVFENAAVYPITILVKKEKQKRSVNIVSMAAVNAVKEINKADKNELHRLPWDIFFWNSSFISILSKINKCDKLIGELIQFENPCTVSEAYEIKNILSDKRQMTNVKKFINSGTINPYSSLWGVKNTSYIKDKYKFPVVTDGELKKLSPRRFLQSQSKKIIIANMTQTIEVFFDAKAEYLAGKSTVIAVGNEDDLYIGAALLNSKLVSFWYKCIYHSTKMSGEALSITAERLHILPVPEISGSNKKALIACVMAVIREKEKTDPCAPLEQQIDNLVYHLYNLTYEDVKVIDPDFPLSKTEYESDTSGHEPELIK